MIAPETPAAPPLLDISAWRTAIGSSAANAGMASAASAPISSGSLFMESLPGPGQQFERGDLTTAPAGLPSGVAACPVKSP